MIELYWRPETVADVVAMALRIIGVEHRIVTVGEDVTEEEYLRINPAGTVPAMVEGDLVLFESVAILEYLEERHPTPALLPADARLRATTRQWMLAAGDYLLGPFHRWLARFFNPETVDQADVERAREDIARHLDVLEKVLDGRDHLTGSFSLADVCYAPFACELETAQLGALLAERPRVRAWTARLNARPSIQASRPAPPS